MNSEGGGGGGGERRREEEMETYKTYVSVDAAALTFYWLCMMSFILINISLN